MNARNKRLKRALKYMAIFTIAPHFILLAVNVAINVFYGIPVTEDIFSLYTPRRVIFFCIVSCIVFLEYYFFITDKSDEKKGAEFMRPVGEITISPGRFFVVEKPFRWYNYP